MNDPRGAQEGEFVPITHEAEAEIHILSIGALRAVLAENLPANQTRQTRKLPVLPQACIPN